VVELFRGRKWDLVGSRRWWFLISAITIAVGLFFWARHGLNFGIDFTGGGLLTYRLAEPLPSDKQGEALATVRQELSSLGIRGDIQLAGSTFRRKDQLIVRTLINPQLSDREREAEANRQASELLTALQKRFPGVEEIGRDMVGGVVSQELIRNAILAVVFGMALVVVWIMIRYDFQYAVCAIIALAHDCLVLTGLFAVLGREVNAPFVAALLTVVGYSVHDTIVIYDRIRENVKLRKGRDFPETVNISLLETMARSVNTILTVLLTVAALFFLGGQTIRDFSLALLIGVTTGGYSSIFNASQLVVVWKQWGKKPAPRAEPLAARPEPVRQSASRPAQPQPQRPAVAAQQTGSSQLQAAEGEAAVAAEPGSAAAQAKRKLKAKKRKRRF
jgi:preprotein translocase subunit SecF